MQKKAEKSFINIRLNEPQDKKNDHRQKETFIMIKETVYLKCKIIKLYKTSNRNP